MLDLDFKFKPSFSYLALLILILVVSVGIVLALSIAPWIKFVMIVLIALYGGYLLWAVALLKGKFAITRVKQLEDGNWSVFTQQGRYHATLRGDSTVTNIVSILRFHTPQQRLPLSTVVFPDSLAGRDYREFLVMLRTLSRT